MEPEEIGVFVMERRQFLTAATGLAMSALARPAFSQAATRTLKFVPQANLASPDPIWTTATIATIHGYMVWDTLYAVDTKLTPQPQMCAGAETSQDGLTWTLHLRDGLVFHDGDPVRASDCVASIRRWTERNPFGQILVERLDSLQARDDRRIEFRLKQPYPALLYALGSTNCFVMPARLASTPATTMLTEFIGSGPFRFLPDRWVSGASAEYARFERYVPRQEPPDGYAGGKIVNFDRVEWSVQPDAATASAALQAGEVDWVEQPLLDLLPRLRGTRGVKVQTNDPIGTMEMLVFNQLQPPFNNQKLRQALLPAIDQSDFITSIVGSQTELGRTGVGFYPQGSPYATEVGLKALTAPRDFARAKSLVAESGYKGEPIVLCEPTDSPPLQAVAEVAADLFKRLGLNVQVQTMDLGTLVARRNKMGPVDQGGWSCIPANWNGLYLATPLSTPLSANGTDGWIGWPSSSDRQALRAAWLDAPDESERKRIAEQVQAESFTSVPFMPVGQYFQPAAFRSNLSGFVRAPFSVFWGVRRD
jgi:peptide/nickel transport system substrate-binding protein